MTTPGEYERLGDIDAPFVVTKKQHRAQEERVRMVESMRCDVPSLTYEAYRAGAPCPGCGRPYTDDVRWEHPGTMHMTDVERARYAEEEAVHERRHGECRSGRHSVSGSLTTHCMKCCPPPPLSPMRIETLSSLLGRRTPPSELMVWRLRLYCAHLVEKQAHRSHSTVQQAFTGSTSCPQCGLDPATIIDATAIGLVEEPPHREDPRPVVPTSPTRAQLAKRVEELEAELRVLREQHTRDDRGSIN